jgi:hypothetical protein
MQLRLEVTVPRLILGVASHMLEMLCELYKNCVTKSPEAKSVFDLVRAALLKMSCVITK